MDGGIMYHAWSSDRVKALLILHGISESELAKEFGISPQAVYRWTKGTKRPTVDMILRWCNRFHIPPSFFFTTQEEAPVFDEEEVAAGV